jgi:hypothetical protein
MPMAGLSSCPSPESTRKCLGRGVDPPRGPASQARDALPARRSQRVKSHSKITYLSRGGFRAVLFLAVKTVEVNKNTLLFDVSVCTGSRAAARPNRSAAGCWKGDKAADQQPRRQKNVAAVWRAERDEARSRRTGQARQSRGTRDATGNDWLRFVYQAAPAVPLPAPLPSTRQVWRGSRSS